MSFEPLPKATTRERYLGRSIEKLPGDLLEACDKIRDQNRELIGLRSDLIISDRKNGRLKAKNAILMAILGGAAAKGCEVAILALLKFFSH